MTSGSMVRASDADRDRFADLLREQTAQGRLSLEEFSERVGAVYAATTRGELDRLVADLPVAPSWHEPTAIQPQASPQIVPVAVCTWPRAITLACLVLVLIMVVLP